MAGTRRHLSLYVCSPAGPLCVMPEGFKRTKTEAAKFRPRPTTKIVSRLLHFLVEIYKADPDIKGQEK